MTGQTRRNWLQQTTGAAAAIVLTPTDVLAQQKLIKRAIPSTGEKLPVIGLGSSATFSQVARSSDIERLEEVMKTLVAQGGTVFDTAPSYGASEEVAGELAEKAGLTHKIFWATKVNVARRGGPADPAEARAQIARSFRRLKTSKIDLIQVHNLADLPTQLAILKELKEKGKVRYIGVTTTAKRQYPLLLETMQKEPLDFIGVDYAIDNREAESDVLPLARERKIGVLVYVPFGRTRLFRRVGDRQLPDWAADFDAKTWAQFFLKFVVAHPAVTAVTPATSKAKNMLDNIGGGVGRLPSPEALKKMVEYVEALPAAG